MINLRNKVKDLIREVIQEELDKKLADGVNFQVEQRVLEVLREHDLTEDFSAKVDLIIEAFLNDKAKIAQTMLADLFNIAALSIRKFSTISLLELWVFLNGKFKTYKESEALRQVHHRVCTLVEREIEESVRMEADSNLVVSSVMGFRSEVFKGLKELLTFPMRENGSDLPN